MSDPIICPLALEDLDDALGLSSAVGWNQRLDDWRMLLRLAPAGAFGARDVSDVSGVSGDEIVDGDDAMTFRQKPIRQMRAEKTRTSGDDRNGLGIFGH